MALNFDKHFKIDFGKKNDDYFLKQSIMIGNHLIDILAEKKWNLVLAKGDDFFVTSDNPVILIRPPEIPQFMGTGFQNGIVAIPISPKHCLWITNGKEPSFTAAMKPEGVKSVNRHLMFFANTFLYGHTISQTIQDDFDKTKSGGGQKIIVS